MKKPKQVNGPFNSRQTLNSQSSLDMIAAIEPAVNVEAVVERLQAVVDGLLPRLKGYI